MHILIAYLCPASILEKPRVTFRLFSQEKVLNLTDKEWERFDLKPSIRDQIRENAKRMLADASALESPVISSPTWVVQQVI